MKFSKIALLGFFVASSALAHQFFPMQTDNGYKVGFWADDHWGQYQVDRVFGISAKDSHGKALKAGYDYTNNTIFIDGKASVASMNYDFGYYTFTKDGKHYAQKRSELTDVAGANEITQTRKIYKMGKSIFAWDDGSKKPLGLKLEIIPLQNPLVLHQGDKLKVQVLLDGKPIQGVEFEDQNDDIDHITTNAKGIATLTLTQPKDGLQIIAANVKLPYHLDRYGDTLQLTTTLSFHSK
ncbi:MULTISPECIES: DUF4198 domain-containing protein [unclassified Campylobacter]|uniref:DUF4198 domain-containing protein n=1 Tax=unclassified Campylobacter TaxID=2593542 RepID=UPI000EA89087|nr:MULTISPECIES: DUF4198 domain-containing protein [unclassified Campylobacter]QOR00984.1 DUF4198 domain-containing protein [Campylobacter sp. 2014D-0216]RKO64706.1 hypothetical protein CKA54_03480 [Campylobacter sp. P255]